MLAMATRKKQNEIQNRINQTVTKLLNAPKLKNLTDTQLEQIAKSVIIDTLKDSLKKEVQKSQIDVDKLKNDWLANFDSAETKRAFKKSINFFLHWLGNKSILDVDSKKVDNYIIFLKTAKTDGIGNKGKRISDNTIRLRVQAPSSFWKSLNRWEVLDRNPFLGCKLPKQVIAVKEAEKIPTDKELDMLESYAVENMKVMAGTGWKIRSQGARYALGAMTVLRSQGLRLGSLPSLTIDKNRNYKATSKGKVVDGRLSKEVFEKIKELELDTKKPFEGYNSFRQWFFNACKALDLKFSPHCYRHKFSCDFYNRTKDIKALSERLSHSNIAITSAYLATLKVELKNFETKK